MFFAILDFNTFEYWPSISHFDSPSVPLRHCGFIRLAEFVFRAL